MTICATTRDVTVIYSHKVYGCKRELRVLPPHQRGTQSLLHAEWKCRPQPDRTAEKVDTFGNRVLVIEHQNIAGHFTFSSLIRTSCTQHGAEAEQNVPATGLGAFLLPSALCDLSPVIVQVANQQCKASLSHREIAEKLCDWAHNALVYKVGVTGPRTKASQALEAGHGVCQDYAHLLIALCRARQLPARYVAGFGPQAGGMHAWVEVLSEGNWHAFDPTYGGMTEPHCVFVAAGRDYRDVRPERATYSGTAAAEVSVWCQTVVEKQSTA